MVTGCGCVDPRVFGHGWRCELDLGPTSSGGESVEHRTWQGAHGQEYDRPAEPEPVRRWHDRVIAWAESLDRRYSALKAAELELYGRLLP